jgi:2,4-diketo-3-deoxy-L-fuconate hydrolase
MQTGNTRTMILPFGEPTSGTPPRVGEDKKPDAVYPKAGDTMDLTVTKLGRQTQSVIARRHACGRSAA